MRRSTGKKICLVLGAILFILGMLLSFRVVTLALVLYDTTPPTFGNVTPPGSSIYSPTPLTAGKQYWVSAYVVDGESRILSVTCEVSSIEGQSYYTLLTLQFTPNPPQLMLPGGGEGGGTYTQEGVFGCYWTVPELANTKLKFMFKAVDEAGNSRTKTTYGLIGAPDGYFTINGKRADEDTRIVVSDPKLTFEFTATNLGSAITNVVVKVSQGGTLVKEVTLTETTADQKWSGSYTLPAQGAYQVDGIVWVGSNSYQKMSLLMEYGGGWMSLTTSQIVGIVIAVVGAALMVYGRKP